jgi:hypothetical protein
MSLSGMRLSVSFIIFGVSLLCSHGACGQSVKHVKGNVRDEAGNIVSNATVFLITDDHIGTSKSNLDGEFDFTNFTAPARYIEVYAAGFFHERIAIADTTPQPLEVTLRIGYTTQCVEPITVPLAYYEERSGKTQLTGSVADYAGALLSHATLTLKRYQLQAPTVEGGAWLSSKETTVAYANTDEKGKFQFEDLEPGSYSLIVDHGGYNREFLGFWIARQNLTRTIRIHLKPEGVTGCEPTIFGQIGQPNADLPVILPQQ